MATWDDLQGLTWAQLEGFTWGQLKELRTEQVQRYVTDVWPTLLRLTPEERHDLVQGFVEERLPVLVADGDQAMPKMYQVALELWDRFKPTTSADLAAWVAALVAAAALMGAFEGSPPEQPPTPIIINNYFPMPPQPPPGGGSGAHSQLP